MARYSRKADAVQEEREMPHDREARIIAKYKEKIKNPQSAIRSHCVECMGGALGSVSDCTNDSCSLYVFRMGKNPFRKRRSKEEIEGDAE